MKFGKMETQTVVSWFSKTENWTTSVIDKIVFSVGKNIWRLFHLHHVYVSKENAGPY